jgi:hypothetical protein
MRTDFNALAGSGIGEFLGGEDRANTLPVRPVAPLCAFRSRAGNCKTSRAKDRPTAPFVPWAVVAAGRIFRLIA